MEHHVRGHLGRAELGLVAHAALSGLAKIFLRGTQRFPDTDHTRYLGTVLYGSPILGQTTQRPAAPWKVAVLRLDVYEIT